MSGGHDHHHEDSIAPGGAPGRIATNWETLTGKERDEYVAKLEGKKPIDIDDEFEPTYLGTKKRPQMIKSVVDVQHVGCSGLLYYLVEHEEQNAHQKVNRLSDRQSSTCMG